MMAFAGILQGLSSAFALAPRLRVKHCSGGSKLGALAFPKRELPHVGLRNDHVGAIHKPRRRVGDDLIRFRQTLGDFQLRS